MIGYTCAWCGGGHLGLDCTEHDRHRSDSMAYLCIQYVRAERLTRHIRRLRRLVVGMQEAQQDSPRRDE